MSDDPGTPMPAPAPPAAAPPRGRLRGSRSLLWIGVLAVVLVAGITGLVTTRGGSSTDGTFSTGDCVALTSSAVRLADCGGGHDGRITAVLHQTYQTCPAGSDEFDVTDNTGNLCIDRSK
jgi:hypothetical protein